MREVSVEMIQELRSKSGVAIGKCKEALQKSDGNMEQALLFLRKAGLASLSQKETRETREGVIVISEKGHRVALVEVAAESDFVVKNEQFQLFAQEVSFELLKASSNSVKDFLSMPYSQDPSLTINQYRALIIQKLGENIEVKRWELWEITPHNSVGIYSHMKGKEVAIVELKGEGYDRLAREIAMHIVAESPVYISPQEIPPKEIEREKEVAQSQVIGKPSYVAEKIIEGKIASFYDQNCLLRQKFVKDPSLSIADLLLKENQQLSLLRFLHWKVGEGE